MTLPSVARFSGMKVISRARVGLDFWISKLVFCNTTVIWTCPNLSKAPAVYGWVDIYMRAIQAEKGRAAGSLTTQRWERKGGEGNQDA